MRTLIRKPHFTLQAKYLILIAAIIISASAILSIYYYSAIKTKEIKELKARGRAVTLNLAHNAEEGVLFSDTQHLSLLVRLVAEDSDVVGVKITNTEGNTLAQIPFELGIPDPSLGNPVHIFSGSADTSGTMAIEYQVEETGIRVFDFSVPITTRRIARGREEVGLMFDQDGKAGDQTEEVRIGTATVMFSSARALRDLRNIQKNIIAITVVVVLACLVLTVPLLRITIRPIRDLAKSTQAIAAGNLTQRVVATTNDEIGDLATCFNQMAVDLEKYHTELRQHSQTLEERVRERTHELKRANEELELANAELRKAQAQLIQAAKMAAMGEFGAGVAHELNQPLAGIKGYAQLLLGMIPEDSPLRPRLLQIDKQASRMREITQTMWNLARQSNFEYSFIDIEQPIQDSLILISEQFRQHQIEIVTEIADYLPLVFGDANQLHQVFLNFLTNAKDAINEGGTGRVKIKVSPIADMRYVQAQIMDNGRGIPVDLIENIFDPFFTTKAPGKGTGLGLSINFSIIEQHHGFINVHSEELLGTTFSIILPTIESAKCSKSGNGIEMASVAPCWIADPSTPPDSHTRRPECIACEIFLRFQKSPPELSLVKDLKEFIAEASGPSPGQHN